MTQKTRDYHGARPPLSHASESVRDLMLALEQDVRDVPTTDISMQDRLLRPRLVAEEALEFVEAMGCYLVQVEPDGSETRIDFDRVQVRADPDRDIDMVEATDALVDIDVIVKGSALTLGAPVDEAFDIVHATNMAKLGPDGKPIKDEHGKGIKPPGWVGPTEGLRALLFERGWDGR